VNVPASCGACGPPVPIDLHQGVNPLRDYEAVLTAAKSRGVLPREAALELAERRVRDAMRYRRFAIL